MEKENAMTLDNLRELAECAYENRKPNNWGDYWYMINDVVRLWGDYETEEEFEEATYFVDEQVFDHTLCV